MPNRATDLGFTGGGCLYASIAASAALTNSTAETALDSVTIAANVLRAGDVIEVIAQGTATATTSSDTILAKIKLGSTIIAATITPDASNADCWMLHAWITIRTDGPSGTLVATAMTANGVIASATFTQYILASTAVDTTAALALSHTGTWSAQSSSDSCRGDSFIVNIHRPVTFN